MQGNAPIELGDHARIRTGDLFPYQGNTLHACQLWRAGRFLRPQRWLQNGQTMAADECRSLTPSAPICIRETGSGPGIRTLNLAVNRSARPVQKRLAAIAECRLSIAICHRVSPASLYGCPPQGPGAVAPPASLSD